MCLNTVDGPAKSEKPPWMVETPTKYWDTYTIYQLRISSSIHSIYIYNIYIYDLYMISIYDLYIYNIYRSMISIYDIYDIYIYMFVYVP